MKTQTYKLEFNKNTLLELKDNQLQKVKGGSTTATLTPAFINHIYTATTIT